MCFRSRYRKGIYANKEGVKPRTVNIVTDIILSNVKLNNS